MGRCKLVVGAVALCLGMLPGAALGQSLKGAAQGNPQIKSIDALAFGPQGLLLIGDGRGRQVVVVDTEDTTPKQWSKTEIPQIDNELAGRVGTVGRSIEILRLAVNPASHTAYVAVRLKEGKKELLLTLGGDGKVNELVLENVKHVRVPLEAGDKGQVTKITDLTWADDRILVAAQANDTFASKIVSIPVPLDGAVKASVCSTETFHVAHNRWETNAPIRTVLPYEQDGKKYLVGAFTCTPIVKYSLDELQPGAKVKGTSVIELGSGNTPQDMLLYEKGGKKYILMNTFRFHHKRAPVGPSPYWAVKVDYTILAENEKVNEKAARRAAGKTAAADERAQVVEQYHGVVHMDRLDRDRVLAVRTDDKGGLSLAVLPLP